MKYLILLATTFSLTSCNTLIGMWRDTKAATQWTARKIDNAANKHGGGGGGDDYGAPVY